MKNDCKYRIKDKIADLLFNVDLLKINYQYHLQNG